MQHDHAEMPTWLKMEPGVNSHDVNSRTSGTNASRSQVSTTLCEPNLVHRSRNRTVMAERAKFTYDENPRWRRPPFEFRKLSISPHWTKVFPPNVVDRWIAITEMTANTINDWKMAYMYSITLATSITSSSVLSWIGVDLSTTSRNFTASICHGLVVKTTTNPIPDMSRCCTTSSTTGPKQNRVSGVWTLLFAIA